MMEQRWSRRALPIALRTLPRQQPGHLALYVPAAGSTRDPERPAVAFITFHMVNIILSIIRLIITTFTSAVYLRPCFSSMLFISIATGQVTSF